MTFRFATIGAPQGDVANAQIAADGPTVTLQGTGEIEEYAARVAVRQGVHVALDAPSASMVYNQGGDKFTYLYAPPLVKGDAPRASASRRRTPCGWPGWGGRSCWGSRTPAPIG